MKRKVKILFCLMLWCGSLMAAGCGHTDSTDSEGTEVSSETKEADVETEDSAQEEDVSESQTSAAAEASGAADDLEQQSANEEKEKRYRAYQSILTGLYENYTLPDKELYTDDLTSGLSDISENTFAIADMDADGEDELIVYYITAIIADQIGCVYDYSEDSGNSYLKFSEYPMLSFYGNGTIEAGWSHNQGTGGEFWPYTLYTYNVSDDSYTTVGYVDAYDRSLYEMNQEYMDSSGRSYPYDVDQDGNGFVYYVYEGSLSGYGETDPVDDKEYEVWLAQYTGGTEKINVTFYNLTMENITQICSA